jgi:hypothetical protein
MHDLNLHPYWPPEIAHGWSGSGGLEEYIAEFAPVLPHRRTIIVGFGSRENEPRSGKPIAVPVDRQRTRGAERYLADHVLPRVAGDGVMVEVVDARVGVRTGVIDLVISVDDDSVLGVEIGWPDRLLRRRQGGPGPEAFWREWRPRQAKVRPTTRRMPDGTLRMEIGQAIGGIGVARSARRPDPSPPTDPRPEPPEPVSFISLPDGDRLYGTGTTTPGGPVMPGPQSLASLSHHPPGDDATGVEAIISGLYLCRFSSPEILTVPPPRPDSSVELSGAGFDTAEGRVELVRWETPFSDGAPWLTVRPPSADLWTDVRVLYGEESVSLWMRPGRGGTVTGGLPRMYAPAFEAPGGVRLAIRMIGRPAPEMRIPVQLTPEGA